MSDVRRVAVFGALGMVGAAISRLLKCDPSLELIEVTRNDVDLSNAGDVERFIEKKEINEVYLCAAKVGGIFANNTYPYDFLLQNLLIQTSVIEACRKVGIKKLMFLGSSCIYPRNAEQPLKETYLLSGHLEKTNEPYALAKIAGIKLCEGVNIQFQDLGYDYRSIMPTNLYGPGDNFDEQTSHVLPGLIARMHLAKKSGLKSLAIWGTGTPRREFLFVDDLAQAAVTLMNVDYDRYWARVSPRNSHINIGYGEDITIAELASLIASVVDYDGDLIFDDTKPDGTPRKLLDSEIARDLGWQPQVALRQGIEMTYAHYLSQLQ